MSSRLRIISLATMTALATLCLAGEASRSYVGGSNAVAVDGNPCGFIRSVDGGAISAQVIEEPAGPDGVVHKHIGQPIAEPVTAQMGFSLAKPVYEWISQSLSGNMARHELTITALDFNYKADNTRRFSNALISEVTFPACDGGSKEPGYLTVTFNAESIQQTPGGEAKSAGPKTDQKNWIPGNFRLQIDGLNTQRVSKIDSFTVRRTVADSTIGDARDVTKQPGKLQIPNLVITILENGADDWVNWHRDFVIQGNNSQEKEKSGTLEFLSANQKEVIARMRFSGMGICRLAPEKSEANAEQIRRLVAELYVEKMEFSTEVGPVQSAAPAAAPAGTDQNAPAANTGTSDTTATPPAEPVRPMPLRPRTRQLP